MPNDTSTLPQSPSALPDGFDKNNAFYLYATFCGDAIRTAASLDVPVPLIRELAELEGWDRKLKPIIDLKQSTRPGDIERAVNRAVNFVQAHRLRMFFERVLKHCMGLSDREMIEYLTIVDRKCPKEFVDGEKIEGKDWIKIFKQSSRFSTRPLADLASALEKAHAMTYLALNDTATDRKERGDDDEGASTAAELHLKLASAMASAGVPSKEPKSMVIEMQLDMQQSILKDPAKP